MRTVFRLTLLMVAASFPASALAADSATCRNYASTLRDKARRVDAACKPGWTCEVQQPWDQARVSPNTARSIASTFEGRADRIDDAQAEIERLRGVVRRDQDAIRNLGVDRTAEQFEDWAETMRQADRDAAFVIVSTLVGKAADRGLTRLGEVATEMGAFNAAGATKVIGNLQKRGINNAGLNGLIRAVANAQGKKARAAAIKKLLERMKEAKGIVMTATNDPDAGLELGKALLDMGLKDPKLKFLVTEVEWTTALIYYDTAGAVSEARIAQLDALTTDQLRNVERLGQILKSHVADLNGAKQRSARLPGCP